MTKKEFLESLYQGLAGSLEKEECYSHIQYYDEYIENEKVKGISEEDVLKSLGNPRLIAKTILASAGHRATDYVESESNTENKENNFLQMVKYWAKVLLIVFVVFVVLRFLFVVFIRVGLPILIIVGVYKLLKKLFK